MSRQGTEEGVELRWLYDDSEEQSQPATAVSIQSDTPGKMQLGSYSKIQWTLKTRFHRKGTDPSVTSAVGTFSHLQTRPPVQVGGNRGKPGEDATGQRCERRCEMALRQPFHGVQVLPRDRGRSRAGRLVPRQLRQDLPLRE
jgi:hypothetical protein